MNDHGLDAEHVRRLATILGKPEADVAPTLEKIAKAGELELLDYCTGLVVPTTISEVRANRINYLLKAEIELPELETMAAHLFQIPESAAQRLVQVAASRFAYEWNDSFKRAVKDVLEKAEWIADKANRYQLLVTSSLVRAWMQEQIKATDKPDMEDVKKGGLIRLQKETYEDLCGRVGAKKVPARAK
ncbi:hypothetical protein GCM10009839_34130 [Catenulispora yoronensis]|uniref:DUF222 domain-containing protein n=1 Tax=Catenulispora yoronensis TaxID=450799 RepID=A0ABN2U9E1_9ACTN